MKKLVLTVDLEEFARQTGISKHQLQFVLHGPEANVEMGSIRAIQATARAAKLLNRAHSKQRQAAIVRRWFEIVPPDDLRQLLSLETAIKSHCWFLFREDITFLPRIHRMIDACLDVILARGCYEEIFALFRGRVVDHSIYLSDEQMNRVEARLVEVSGTTAQVMEVVSCLCKLSSPYAPSETDTIYRFLLEKAAEIATPEEAFIILRETLRPLGNFDVLLPGHAAIARKAAEYFEKK